MKSQKPHAFPTKPQAVTRVPNGGSIELFVGPQPRGPKRCLKCGKEIKNGQVWRRYTSPPDPEFGSYSVAVHEACAKK